jgi:hypothetical protein
MSLGYGVVQLDVTIVNTALHAIGTSLGGGVAELQWVVTAYTITFMTGLHASLVISVGVLLAAGAVIWWGASAQEGAARPR